MKNTLLFILSAILILTVFVLEPFFTWMTELTGVHFDLLIKQKRVFLILGFSGLSIFFIKRVKRTLLRKYDITQEDNLRSRKLHTQFDILERVVVFTVILITLGLILLSFEGIRKIGVGIFASAGVAGIIIGLSAQKIVGALLAGIQIALTQPFRIDDAVVVENEWGWIEEINLTYVVVRLWDKRRLVLPSTYFLEKPFQNWTRNNADIIGSVFLYTDYTIPFNKLREELTRLLHATDLWDEKVNVLQVTDSKPQSVEIRILVSAKNSTTAWDLRVYIREKMIEYIQKNFPESLPKTRIIINEDNAGTLPG